jgi:hypothetical protein
MSKKNNTNLATKALLEMDEITAAIKEGSKKTLNALLAEAVKDALREKCNETEEEDEYEVQGDEESTNDVENETETEIEEPAEENGFEDVEKDPETSEGDNEWDEFSKYQVSDDTYDLTGEDDYESVVKVYKLLKNDDQVVVKKEGDKIQLKDDSVGTEYVIDLGDETEVNDGEEEFDSLNEGVFDAGDEYDALGGSMKLSDYYKSKGKFPTFNHDDIDDEEKMGYEMDNETDFEGPSDGEIEDFDISDYDTDMEYDEEYDDEIAGIEDAIYESVLRKINKLNENKKVMKDNSKVLFEVDLGYTDNYQSQDPIAGLSNEEPSKTGKSWHKGVPTGTEKPWAGKSKSKSEPFEKTINEEDIVEMDNMEEPIEEAGSTVSTQPARHATSHKTSNVRKENLPQGSKKIRTAGDGYMAENKALKAENKVLKEALLTIKGKLSEAYVTNVNLGKITKLFLENTTSQQEKVDIVNRFSNEAKTIEQSNALYESIKRELNKTTGSQIMVNEAMTTPNGSANINESKVYKSNDLLKTIDLMNRIKNI